MKNKMLLFNVIGICLNFYLLPFFARGQNIETVALLLVMPVITIILGVLYTHTNKPHWFYPVIVGLLFVPSMWLFYSFSAEIYALINFLAFIVGCLVGIIANNLTLKADFKHSKIDCEL